MYRFLLNVSGRGIRRSSRRARGCAIRTCVNASVARSARIADRSSRVAVRIRAALRSSVMNSHRSGPSVSAENLNRDNWPPIFRWDRYGRCSEQERNDEPFHSR